jgi:hypothetical protein
MLKNLKGKISAIFWSITRVILVPVFILDCAFNNQSMKGFTHELFLEFIYDWKNCDQYRTDGIVKDGQYLYGIIRDHEGNIIKVVRQFSVKEEGRGE